MAARSTYCQVANAIARHLCVNAQIGRPARATMLSVKSQCDIAPTRPQCASLDPSSELPEITVNLDLVEGIWKRFRGRVREFCGALIGNARLAAAGAEEIRVGRNQARYGAARERAASQLREFQHRNRDWDPSHDCALKAPDVGRLARRISRHIQFVKGTPMSFAKIAGIVLIVLGCLGLAYGGFSYTKETTKATLGPLELKVNEQETVNVPVIVSAGAIAIGIFLLVAGRVK
jgi:uncharacterized protein YjbJ (UPF0337 family)